MWILILYCSHCQLALGDTYFEKAYLKSWMTEFFKDFFFQRVGGGIKKTPSSPLRHGRSEKKISYSLAKTLPSLLIADFAATISTSFMSLGWSVALVMHQALQKACCMLILEVLVCVQWARKDRLGGLYDM